ncbi:urea transporter [Chitinophaga qingshengii]|uniref:Urea transporter n=1 Tax=Chitinophaga qingshengii TaxID=1569794 RepID=A0ABR7TPB4_9BACT|nr:urea transporter [Chitinophaga qingshengii]MBC9932314.1 urea transporter [Chitinophaga qingshengii]
MMLPYLRGVGQIMLQNNAWTGALFLAGIFYDSVIMGIAAVVAVVTGTLTAKLFRYNEADIEAGLYGFSATLVGVALTFYFNPVPVVWIAVVLGSVAATWLQHVFISRGLPGFTFPFILVTWILLYLFLHVYRPGAAASVAGAMPVSDDFTTATNGFGEVIFQGSVVAGIIFFVAVFISSPIAALYGVCASLLGAFISLQFAEPAPDIHMGLFSFNAVLCAITFAGNKPRDGIWVLFSVVLSVLLDVWMLQQHMAVLTFPFVAASWITLALQHLLQKMGIRIKD